MIWCEGLMYVLLYMCMLLIIGTVTLRGCIVNTNVEVQARYTPPPPPLACEGAPPPPPPPQIETTLKLLLLVALTR